MFMINPRLLFSGLAIWAGATLALRFAGQYLLRPGSGRGALILFALSFPLMALLARQLCRRAKLRPEEWPAGAVSLMLPTLLLDPFSTAFFPAIFPNMSPQVAGVFGGWILWCCAGVAAGVIVRRRLPA